jgi:hypothetical protein
LSARDIQVFRYSYGKACKGAGGPVPAGFEHRVTSISAGLSEDLLAFCRPAELLDNRQLRTVVHPKRVRDGAIWFWPAACGGRRWMLAGCLRERAEAGEGELSRTFNQLATYVFTEADWNRHAPLLLATAGQWLKAEPDVLEDYERYAAGEPPPSLTLDLAALGAEPPCLHAPLPAPGTLLWRLTTALEDIEANQLIGAAAGIRSAGMFLKALACATALLPEPLRIYVTAAAGFAQQEYAFALQYLPDAPAAEAAAPGLLERVAERWLRVAPGMDLDGWQRCWRERAAPRPTNAAATADAAALALEPPLVQLLERLSKPQQERLDPYASHELRHRYARELDQATAGSSVAQLRDYLRGIASVAPAQPARRYEDTGTEWIRALVRHIDGQSPRSAQPKDQAERRGPRTQPIQEQRATPEQSSVGVGRALHLLAHLIPGNAEDASVKPVAEYWIRAFHAAARSDPAGPRRILKWTALLAASRVDELEVERERLPPGVNPLHQGATQQDVLLPPRGHLQDFTELRALAEAIKQAKRESQEAAALVAPLLEATAVKRRIRVLRRRADRVLVRRPLVVMDLAASFPGLLAPRADDAPGWVEQTQAALYALLLAGRCYRWAGQPPPEPAENIVEATAKVAERSLGLDTGDAALKQGLLRGDALQRSLHTLLLCYWRWSLAPDDERDTASLLWRDGVVNLLRLLGRDGPGPAVRLLLLTAQPSYTEAPEGEAVDLTDLTKAQPAAETLFAAALDAIAPLVPDPVATAVGLLETLSDLRALGPHTGSGVAHEALAEALFKRIAAALDSGAADPEELFQRVLPLLDARIQKLRGHAANGVGQGASQLTARALARTLQLADALLGRLLAAPTPLPNQPVAQLFDELDTLLATAHCSETVVEQAADRLGGLLGRCILVSAEVDPPAFWTGSPLAGQDVPIRRRLARRLGYPRSAYFGGLTTADEGSKAVMSVLGFFAARKQPMHRWTKDALGLSEAEAPPLAITRVIGQGAASCWRRLFNSPDKAALGRLLNKREFAPANNEAWNALAAIAAADPAAQAAIDPEVLFVADFFARLGPDACERKAVAMPDLLKTALLGGADAEAGSLAIQLGRLVALSAEPAARGGQVRFDFAANLVRIFRVDDAREMIGRRVLQARGGWDGLADDRNKRQRKPALLRLLYLLALVRCQDAGVGIGVRLEVGRDDLLRSVQLPPANTVLRDWCGRYLKRHADIAAALRDAAQRAGLETLPGWPLPSATEPRD